MHCESPDRRRGIAKIYFRKNSVLLAFFATWPLISKKVQHPPPVKSIWLSRRSRTNNLLRHFTYPSPNFDKGKIAKFVLDFFLPQSPLNRSDFQTEQHIGNLKTHRKRRWMLSILTQKFCQFMPYFMRVSTSRSAKFSLCGPRFRNFYTISQSVWYVYCSGLVN